MIYILMHKDVKVLELSLDNNFEVKRIIEIYNKNHMPFATSPKKNDSTLFKNWWKERSIPITRDDYSNLLKFLPNDKPLSLVVKTHALSLTDQYWIRKANEQVSFDDISFFSNKFMENIGDFLIGNENPSTKNIYYSPDSTSIGNLKKRWKIINGKRYLLKAGSRPNQYEIFNEIIATKVMNYLHINHVNYEFYSENSNIYCRSENFISYNEDFVPAKQLLESTKIKNDESLFSALMSVYEKCKIPNYKTELNKMLFIDYLLGNVDRHLNNFGVIRDAKTLEFLRISPIYDTGSCLGFDLKDEELTTCIDVEWKPFKTRQIKTQLDLIDDYSWLEIDVLKGVLALVIITMKEYANYLPKSRQNAIISFLCRRINNVYKYLGFNDEVIYHPVHFTILEKQILTFIKENEQLINLHELASKLNVSYITIYRSVSELTSKNILKRFGSRKRGYWILNSNY